MFSKKAPKAYICSMDGYRFVAWCQLEFRGMGSVFWTYYIPRKDQDRQNIKEAKLKGPAFILLTNSSFGLGNVRPRAGCWYSALADL